MPRAGLVGRIESKEPRSGDIEARKKEYAKLCGRLRKKLKILVDEAALNRNGVYGQEHPWDTDEKGAE